MDNLVTGAEVVIESELTCGSNSPESLLSRFRFSKAIKAIQHVSVDRLYKKIMCGGVLFLVCAGVSAYAHSIPAIRKPKVLFEMPGMVFVSDKPVLGGHIYLLSASPKPPGSPSQSLMSISQPGQHDEIGAYVTADERGAFVVRQTVPCTPGAAVYIYTQGGHRYLQPENPRIGLLLLVGTCSASGAVHPFSPRVLVVTERTTVQAAFSLADFGPDPTHMTMERYIQNTGSPAVTSSKR